MLRERFELTNFDVNIFIANRFVFDYPVQKIGSENMTILYRIKEFKIEKRKCLLCHICNVVNTKKIEAKKYK